jgi:uncharacterized protein YdiU (UPF0061 family)
LTNFEANAKQNEVKINNRFELPADADETNTRQVKTRFSYVTPQIPSNPKVVHIFGGSCSTPISIEDTKSNEFTNIFSGKELLPHSRPYSMSYAGHQFERQVN